SLTVLALYGALILLEALFPARPLPRIKGWKTKALVVFILYFFLSSYLPLLWGDTLAAYQLFDLTALNPVVGAGIAVLVYELLVYVWHRTMHRVLVVARVPPDASQPGTARQLRCLLLQPPRHRRIHVPN